MSDSVQPHRWQPTRFPRPWDSPGKNTGVGCPFLLQCMKVKSGSEVTQSYRTVRDPMDCSLPGSSIHGIFQARVLEWGAIAFSKRMAEVSIVQVPNFQQMIARHTEKQENMAQTKEENKSPETNTEDSYIYTSPNTEFNVTFLKAAQ